jgi:hypothetical protein
MDIPRRLVFEIIMCNDSNDIVKMGLAIYHHTTFMYAHGMYEIGIVHHIIAHDNFSLFKYILNKGYYIKYYLIRIALQYNSSKCIELIPIELMITHCEKIIFCAVRYNNKKY